MSLDSMGIEQFYDQKNPNFLRNDVIWQVNSKFKKMFSSLDTQLPTIQLESISFFKEGNHCPMAPLFGAEISLTINRISSGTNICGSFENSCCMNSSYTTFYNDWKRALIIINNLFASQTRISDFLMDNLQTQKYFISSPANPDILGCKGKVNHARCKVFYDTISDAIKHAKMYRTQYKKDWKTCHEKLEEVRLEMRCASCDESVSKYFDNGKRVAYVKRNQINNVIRACYDQD